MPLHYGGLLAQAIAMEEQRRKAAPALGLLSQTPPRQKGILESALGPFADPQFYKDIAGNVPDVVRGLGAQTLGAPVDLMTMGMRPFGYNVPSEQTVGSTDWIGKKMGANVQGLPFQISSMLPTDPSDVMRYGGFLAAGPIVRGLGKEDGVAGMAKYAGHHRPMRDAGGAARLHDLTKSFPEDIYSNKALQYYGSGDKRENAVLRLLHGLRGKPDAEVTIYRGIPKDAPANISPGDWVTLSKDVAQDYGDQVVSMKVKAKDITSWADSLLEFGYFPSEK